MLILGTLRQHSPPLGFIFAVNNLGILKKEVSDQPIRPNKLLRYSITTVIQLQNVTNNVRKELKKAQRNIVITSMQFRALISAKITSQDMSFTKSEILKSAVITGRPSGITYRTDQILGNTKYMVKSSKTPPP